MSVTHCSGPLYYRTRAPDQHRLKALRRPSDERVLAGVAAAMAGFLRVDITAVRIAFVVLTLLGGAAVTLYAAGWLLIPAEGAELSIGQELVRTLRRH